jgi:hypothetical protein
MSVARPYYTRGHRPHGSSVLAARDAILDAVQTERWRVESVRATRVNASISWGSRTLQAAISFDDRYVKVDYLRSERLRASTDGPTISAHPEVNRRLEQLEARVRTSLASMPSCSRLLVITSAHYKSSTPLSAEITTTRTYEIQRTRYQRVAVFGPTRCAGETAAQLTGEQAGRASAVAQTTCGSQIADIERELSKAGYDVISSEALVARENMATSPLGPLRVASELGAQVIFQVNSLERLNAAGLLVRGQHTRRYFQADPNWRPVNAVPMTDGDIASIEQVIDDGSSREQETQPGAMLDVTALDPTTGLTLFMYRHRLIQPVEGDGEVMFRLLQVDSPMTARHTYRLQSSDSAIDEGERAHRRRSAVAFETSHALGDVDPIRQVQACLVRRLIGDLVSRFRSGDQTTPTVRTACAP